MRERFLDPVPDYDSFMPEWRNCTSKRSERIEIFHSEGLKTRGSFCIWWKDFYDPTKIEYFFDNRIVFFYPVVQRGWEDFSKRFPIRAKKRLPLVLIRWGGLRSLTTEWPSERGYDRAMIWVRRRCGETPGQAYKNDVRVKRRLYFEYCAHIF